MLLLLRTNVVALLEAPEAAAGGDPTDPSAMYPSGRKDGKSQGRQARRKTAAVAAGPGRPQWRCNCGLWKGARKQIAGEPNGQGKSIGAVDSVLKMPCDADCFGLASVGAALAEADCASIQKWAERVGNVQYVHTSCVYFGRAWWRHSWRGYEGMQAGRCVENASGVL
eukprot:2718856-Amphidinium_carterae.1